MNIVLKVLRFLSQLLKSIWIFFPGILFLLFTIFCFWSLGQGKDIIVDFTENKSRTIFGLNYTRLVFFLAIGFWVYVSWYSSRIISYIKRSRQEDDIKAIAKITSGEAGKEFNRNKNYFEISSGFLDEFPRIIGNGCFLVLELAVLQSPILSRPISSTWAWILFIVSMIILRYLNKWINDKHSTKPSFRRSFWIMLFLLLLAIIAASLFTKIPLLILFALLVLFHIVFLFYINLRRADLEKHATMERNTTLQQKKNTRSIIEKLMDYFCIPRNEKEYLKWFLLIGIAGIIFYCIAIFFLSFARGIGPFPFMILAFAVLLGFGNFVTAFSVKYKVNFHFLLFVLALFLGIGETHYVRTIDTGNNNYENRPQLNVYLDAWLNERSSLMDSSATAYDIYFVMANGGASRSGYWTAAVLGKIEDSSIVHSPTDRFSDHIFCLSGTSGGGVGVAAFFSLLRNKQINTRPLYEASAKKYLEQDYFTYTFARMLGPDFFNYIFHVSSAKDRAAALEMSFEESSRNYDTSYYQVPFHDRFSSFPAFARGQLLPILCVNTTRMQDGNPGVVTNLKLDSAIFNNRVDVLKLLKNYEDISITSGAILGARFPYLSPAGRIGDNYFVDGGYFDNSGAGVVQEIIRGILNIAKDDSMKNGTLYKKINKLHFKVIHIVNSPVDLDSSNIVAVAPVKNDLMAPILTIAGAYDMQTTVNDGRLINYIKDINKYTANRADYTQISLYEDSTEWKHNPLSKRFASEPPYAMNWFMSDTTLDRINARLLHCRKLKLLIKNRQQNK